MKLKRSPIVNLDSLLFNKWIQFCYMLLGIRLLKVKVKVTQSCPTLCDLVYYTVH